jgi:hypothetical protein
MARGAAARYGYFRVGVRHPGDRELGIAGRDLVVVDLRSGEVLAVQRSYVRFTVGVGERSASVCPEQAGGREALADFVHRVLVQGAPPTARAAPSVAAVTSATDPWNELGASPASVAWRQERDRQRKPPPPPPPMPDEGTERRLPYLPPLLLAAPGKSVLVYTCKEGPGCVLPPEYGHCREPVPRRVHGREVLICIGYLGGGAAGSEAPATTLPPDPEEAP